MEELQNDGENKHVAKIRNGIHLCADDHETRNQKIRKGGKTQINGRIYAATQIQNVPWKESEHINKGTEA